jgi:rubredoxin
VTSFERYALLESFRSFAEEIKRSQNQAKAQGLFANDRGLLDCPDCGLTEDVQFDNRLTTYWWHGDLTHDTGLRFKELLNDQWQCPNCGCTMAALEMYEHREALRIQRFDMLLDCGFKPDVQLTPISEVTTNQLYRACDQQTPPREAIVCFDTSLDTTTLEWLSQQTGKRVIVLEAALNTTSKWNLHHQLGDGLVVF